MRYEATGFKNTWVSTPIEKQRFEEVKRAKTTCLFAVDLEEKFALLLDNFAEFEFELLRLAESSLIWPNRNHTESMQERLTLDRRIVNLLTACRLYLDQTDHGLAGLFGNPSQQLKDAKTFKNELYDNHGGYRLMEALRNHVQHSGLPVHIISYNSSRIEGKDLDYTQFTVVPSSNARTLAESDGFKKTVLAELLKKGEHLDLRGPAREYLSCLSKLHDKNREIIKERFVSSRLFYEKAVQEFSSINGDPIQLPQLREVSDEDAVKEVIELVTHFLGYYEALLEKNHVSQNLQRSFASNSDQRRN